MQDERMYQALMKDRQTNQALWAMTDLEAAALHLLKTLERAREALRTRVSEP